MNIDKGLENFRKLKSELSAYTEELSETDTRSKYLDRIFIDVLGWNEENIEREGYVKPGFFDYEFSTANYRFVVEAKKINVTFSLPSKGQKVKLKTLYNGNTAIVNQIREYIQKRNLAYGIISNGKQFVVARFINTNGGNWLDNDAFFFDGLDAIENRFIDFYNLFSFESVIKHGRIKLANEEIVGKCIVEHKLLKKRTDEVLRNDFSDILVSIIGQIFSEIYETDDLNNYSKLKECYVRNEDVKASNSKLGILFQDEPPHFDSRILPVKNTEHTQQQISKEIQDVSDITPEPVIIIGSKGAGKTTFIRHFIEVELAEKFKKKRPILYIDFRNYTNQQVEDTKGIYFKIYRQLVEKYEELKLTELNILKTIYQKEIKEKTQGIWSLYGDNEQKLKDKLGDFLESKLENIDNHLENIAIYLKKFQGKRLTIILDNADQLDDESQRNLFLLAHSLRKSLNALCLISLREGYFYQWKNKPPFDAYQSNVFHITAPPYRDVLKNRIDYVINNFDFDSIKTNHRDKKLQLSAGTFKNFFTSLSASLFVNHHSDLIEFLEECSYPNIREGLDNFNAFLTSGHTQIADYITSSSYKIPVWEFIKSIALESQYYYKSEFSRVKNIFKPTANSENHFTKVRLLFYLQNIAELNKYQTTFCSINEMIDLFSKSGYGNEELLAELTELLSFKLIETKASQSDIEKESILASKSEVRITLAGNYYITKLITRFHYLDLVVQDTPIFDEFYFERIKESFPEVDSYGERDIQYRLITVATFIEYLKKREWFDHTKNELNYGHKVLDLDIVDYIERTGLNHDIERIERRKSQPLTRAHK
jgi:GTPase SAR1 family protein